jgi:hypothetical protein
MFVFNNFSALAKKETKEITPIRWLPSIHKSPTLSFRPPFPSRRLCLSIFPTRLAHIPHPLNPQIPNKSYHYHTSLVLHVRITPPSKLLNNKLQPPLLYNLHHLPNLLPLHPIRVKRIRHHSRQPLTLIQLPQQPPTIRKIHLHAQPDGRNLRFVHWLEARQESGQTVVVRFDDVEFVR